MLHHAPHHYVCPLCVPAQGIESDGSMMKQDDIFYKDDLAVCAINSKFVDSNPGHVIIFPIEHYECIYDLPDIVSARIAVLSKRVAIALKEMRDCDGITLQQNNEPAGGQHAFHYHQHIFPRWEGDMLYSSSSTRVSTPEDRVAYAQELRTYFHLHPPTYT